MIRLHVEGFGAIQIEQGRSCANSIRPLRHIQTWLEVRPMSFELNMAIPSSISIPKLASARPN
mgnify:CR=1 FL=1